MTFARSLLVALLTLACCATAASAEPRYEAETSMFAWEDWDYESGDFPNPCAPWTSADGELKANLETKGRFIFASGGASYQFGGLSSTATGSLTVRRELDYLTHQAGLTAACAPCGPSSELGECKAGPPDDRGHEVCKPEPAQGRVLASLAKGLLVVTGGGSAAPALRKCAAVPAGIPSGSADPKFVTEKFRGAGRIIARLAPGQQHKFQRRTQTGNDCGKRKKKRAAVLLTCKTFKTIVIVRRLKDA
jgi:hypothetical protein